MGRITVQDVADSYLLTNGSIWTGDPAQPWAQAVVVRGRDLVHVGTREAADDFIDTATEFVDLNGGMCLPGFIDAHNHLASMALSKLGVNLSGVVGRDAVLAAVRDWVAAQSPDAPLRGHGWMPDSFQERSPRREWLDEITGDRPMYLFSADAHDSWFNTAAMRAAGIGPETPDPDPGAQYWVRDPDGTPPDTRSRRLRPSRSWSGRTCSQWRMCAPRSSSRCSRPHPGG